MKGQFNRFPSAFLARECLILFLLSAGSACLLGIGTPPATAGKLAFSYAQAPKSVRGTLTFAERVAYQYGIEDVYWRHRIWPKHNPQPKPSLDAVISQERVEKKVTDYLGKSQLVTEQRGWPIVAGELQAEMDRMASHTRQPEVLHELFETLGNDPFVIAECLARPILAERMVNNLQNSTGNATNRAATPMGNSMKSFDVAQNDIVGNGNNALYRLPEISAPLDCTDDSWSATNMVNAPDARAGHTAVWTGSEMIVWGGDNYINGHLNTGARYNPTTDSWAATAVFNAPTGRVQHKAVWTGSEMIIWGGGTTGGDLNTGGRYNVASDSWTATSTVNAPIPRSYHTAVWIGSEMIVWGGRDNEHWFNSGGRYNPGTDSWVATNYNWAPSPRYEPTAVWTGSEMIIWGGTSQTHYLHTGGRYNPATDSWIPTGTSVVNVPIGRVDHTAIWTGTEMIVWGGVDETFSDTNTGGRYNPSTDSWTPTSIGSGPSPRDTHTAVWTGSEMIIWGGYTYPPGIDLNTGGRYNPAGDSWTPTSTTNVPLGRDTHTAVWTGSEMIVWGGLDTNFNVLNTGGRYCVQTSTPVLQNAVSRKTHGSAGDFDIALPLTGGPGVECRSGSTTNDYTLVVTFLANVSVTGNPQAAVTSGVGTIGTGGVSNGGTVTIADNVVTIPVTNVTNSQTIEITLYGVNGSTNFVISMSILVGDTNGNGSVNAADVSQTKSRVGQQINGTNFRSDVNANGYIDAADIALVKSKLGTGLP